MARRSASWQESRAATPPTRAWPKRSCRPEARRSPTCIAAPRRSTYSPAAPGACASGTKSCRSGQETVWLSRLVSSTSCGPTAGSRWCCCAAARQRTRTRTPCCSRIELTRYDQWKQRREERRQRDELAEQARRRREEEERIAERDRKLEEQTEYWKMRVEETRKLHDED